MRFMTDPFADGSNSRTMSTPTRVPVEDEATANASCEVDENAAAARQLDADGAPGG
jgi:hypothetical protein